MKCPQRKKARKPTAIKLPFVTTMTPAEDGVVIRMSYEWDINAPESIHPVSANIFRNK